MEKKKSDSPHAGHRDRLKNQYREHGMDVLSDHQVLELLLFYAIPRQDTDPLARRLLAEFGSLSGVLDASAYQLKSVEGMGENASLLLRLFKDLFRRYEIDRAVKPRSVRSGEDAADFLRAQFYGLMEEQIYLLCLDASGRIIFSRMIEEGTVNTVFFPIRRIAAISSNCGAVSVLLGHNHPDGHAQFSQEDVDATKLLFDVLAPMGIQLLDHVLISGDDWRSMRSEWPRMFSNA